MELETSVDNIDDIAEPLRVLYKQENEDGPYTLAVDPEQLEEHLVPGLKSALQKERSTRRQLEKKLGDETKRFEGIDPDEVLELKKLRDETERKKLENAGEWDKLKAQMNEQHATELAKRDQRTKQLMGQIEKLVVDNVATAAIAAAKGEPTLLLPHIRARTTVVEEDGEFQVRVISDKKEPRVKADGEYMSIADLVNEMRSDSIYQRAFDGSGASGGGTPPSNNGGAGGTKKRSEMSVEEKSAFIEKNGLETFLTLPY